MSHKKKERLDRLVVERGLLPTRAKAQAHILAGEVRVNGEVVDKAGTPVSPDAQIELAAALPWVGRGGYKLAAALEAFALPVAGQICADVGACTGGFTDVLLQAGAARVYAIDVGYGQLDWKLRQDPRVVTLERTNARYLEQLPEAVRSVVIDVSFISLRLILPAVVRWAEGALDVVALVKPQFEAGREQVGKGGIVRDPAVHQAVLDGLTAWAPTIGLHPAGTIPSPIEGADGNREFLLWLTRR
jgi:23S rRNA (cytidine1920-2'-O)/16S rRNA (cytidine1409-2'-O)-methyltransferase